MQGKWKWTAIPVMLVLVTSVALGGATDVVDQAERRAEPAPQAPMLPQVDVGVVGLARALAIAEAVGAWQLAGLGEPVAPSVATIESAHAQEALSVLAARHGASLPVTELLALRLLDPALDAALTDVVVAFLALETEATAAFSHLAPMQDREQVLALAKEVRLAGVVAAQERLLAAAIALQEVLASDVERPLTTFQVDGVYAIDLRAACSNDVYTTDLPLIVDDCGDDAYRNNAGGGSGLVLVVGCGETAWTAAAVIDHAGNDVYGTAQRTCALNGGAFGGAGFLYDGGGSDLYNAGEPDGLQAGNDGTNGGAVAGAGMLVDVEGDDVYLAGGWGTNGGGYPGARGFLLDLLGDDLYRASFDAVNGGGIGGAGTLWDDDGNDRYDAWGSGANGGATGVGLLYDRRGVDVYSDGWIGTATDLTVIPKETDGAQIDDDA